MDAKDCSVYSHEMKAVEKDYSSKFQENKAMEDKESSWSSREMKAMEDLEVLVFASLGRKRVQPNRIPDISFSAVADADYSATTANDFTTTVSMLSASLSSSNAQPVNLSSEDDDDSSFMAATASRSGSEVSSMDSSLSATPSVPHLDISGTALSSPVASLSNSNATSWNPLVQEDLEGRTAGHRSQKHQFPNAEERSDPRIPLDEPNQRKTQKDKIFPVTTGDQLPTSAVNTEPKELPLMRISRVLRGIPHCPHFIHLRNFSPLARTKLVSLWDEIFEEAVDEIHSLRVENFSDRTRDLWVTMDELHELGYNVLLPRIRLVEMLNVMEELKQLEVDIQSCENKDEQLRMESLSLESSILDLKASADFEEDDLVSVLKEMRQIENKLPTYDDLVSEIAKKPF